MLLVDDEPNVLRGSGRHLDPEVGAAFLRVAAEFAAIDQALADPPGGPGETECRDDPGAVRGR